MAERHRIIGPVAVLILLAAISAISWSGAAPASAATPISVTTTADELNTDGDCSLREAVQAVNTATAVDACPAGSNHIVLPTGRFSVASALVVRAPMVVTGGGRLTDNTGIVSSIDGFGSGPEPVAPHVFQVAAGGALTLERLSIQTAATQMISADAGAGTLTLSGIDTYDGGYGSPAFVTVDSPVVVTGVAFQNYYSTVGSTDRGSITVSESTASSPAACAFCAGSGSITVQHSATTNLRTSTGPITVRRSFVGSSGSNGGPVHPSIWSDSGPITVDSSSVSYAVAGVLTGGGTSIVRSSTLRPLTSGPAIQLSGTASLTATSSILTCSSTTGVHSSGHNITDGSCGFHGTGDLVGDPQVASATIGPARNNSMQIDVGFRPNVGSIAIDHGGDCEAVDQRGFSRPVDGDRDLTSSCDIGAVEARPARALVGDWDGNGTDTPAEVVGNTFFLRNTNSKGGPDLIVKLGSGSGTPIAGDWNGDGIDTIGVVQGDVWYLSNSNTAPKADLTFKFAVGTGTPVVGDWNGDGLDTVGVVKGNVWSIRNSNAAGAPDATFTFGSATSTPVVGDWNGDGTDSPGAVDSKTWRIVDGLGTGPVTTFSYGAPGPVVAGDWDGNGKDGPGRVPSGSIALTWQLRNQPSAGIADLTFSYGNLATT